jgi:16S rRNA pseudouridine516 synthase
MVFKGLVTVNSSVCRDISFKVDTDTDKILVDGKDITYKKYVYIMINKPKGVLSASNDKSRETVVDIVKADFPREGLFPVGRLDKDTTGLLIITDDGDFAHKVLSPKKNIFKTYKVTLDGDINEDIIRKFEKGVVLADGTQCRPAILRELEKGVAEIKISEGRYHQIKCMFGMVDLGVNELERTSLGGLQLPKNLDYGQCRELSKEELDSIFVN